MYLMYFKIPMYFGNLAPGYTLLLLPVLLCAPPHTITAYKDALITQYLQ